MTKLLYIKANSKPAGTSRTFKIADAFIEAYKKDHPEDEIETVDVFKEDLVEFTPDYFQVRFSEKTSESKNNPYLRYAYQFQEADKIVIAAPFWNLSIPYRLKQYLDSIAVVGIAFHYTDHGPVGHYGDKKLLHIVTRGGDYSLPEMQGREQGDRYLRALATDLLGIKKENIYTIVAQGLDGCPPEEAKQKVQAAIKEAKELAKDF